MLCLLYWTRYLLVPKGLLSFTLRLWVQPCSSITEPCKDSMVCSKTFKLGAFTLALWLRDDLSNHHRPPCNPSCQNNVIPKTLSWTMAQRLGHLTGIQVSLLSHPFALPPQSVSSPAGSSWSSSCWSVYRPQPNTRWLAHSSSMSVYAGNQSMHVRTEPHGAKGWTLGKWKPGPEGAAGAWGGALESEDLWWKHQLHMHDEKRWRIVTVSTVWSLWILFLPEVRGHTLHQHKEQNSKAKVCPASQPALVHVRVGITRTWRFYQILFAFFHEKVGSSWTGSMCSQRCT